MSKKETNSKSQTLKEVIKEIRDKFGEEAVMMLDQKPKVNVDALPTGSLGLDLALGVGGLPRGRIVEIFGPESSGKTTLALHAAAEAQKKGYAVAFIDAEHAMDPQYAQRLGVDTSKLLISQPSSGEEAMQVVDTMVRSNTVGLIIIDSVAHLTPRAELEGEIGETHVGRLARLMSQSMRMLTSSISKSNTIVIFINQIRMNINAMFGANPETTPGGMALRFASSVRIEIRRIQTLKDGEKAVGGRVRCKVLKNKVAPPFRVCEFDIMYNIGINQAGEVIDMAEKCEILVKSGAFYSWGDHKLGRGFNAACEWLRANPEHMQEILREITAKNQ